jgi:TLC domain
MTGSKAQLYNGIALLATFFSCRLVWGSYQTVIVYSDMWRATWNAPDASHTAVAYGNSTDPNVNMMAFVTDPAPVPVWLVSLYVASNIVLNILNWHWFFKMITAVKKRFEPPKEDKKEKSLDGAAIGSSTATGEKPPVLHRRRHSLQDVMPDSEELRAGTIQ